MTTRRNAAALLHYCAVRVRTWPATGPLTRQAKNTRDNMILKTPKALRVGMTGVRIPGHIGTWSIVEALSRVRGGEDVKLYVCHSETFGRACNVLYAGDTGRAYVILSNSDAASVAEREGYR